LIVIHLINATVFYTELKAPIFLKYQLPVTYLADLYVLIDLGNQLQYVKFEVDTWGGSYI